MVTAEIRALIERLEADLAALKKAITPPEQVDDEALRTLARERAARLRAKAGAR